jgi:hypothetical protein
VAERVRGLSGPEHQGELVLAGGRAGREEPEDKRDLATRLREAWETREGAQELTAEVEGPEVEATGRDGVRGASLEDSRSFADRLRAVVTGIDSARLAEAAAALREGREAEERQAALEAAAREQDLAREREREIEAEDIADRLADRGPSHGL